ncbi:ABC transporter permease [Desmospora profundinema]|uniref:Iron(III) transport system permease protein n=1 Tax=Desmospora profundinema TaxID=1571184 RepID=A0ABU1IJB2_9BACL|nr:iron ABC transporter permease [Desmospora profundinema]MDR6224867.1 iron(III) transport system permease protein [Desmospora profundinema]
MSRFRFWRRWGGLDLLRWSIVLFFLVFLIVPLLSIFLVSLTGEPVNLFGSLVNPAIFQSTVEKLSGASLEGYRDLWEESRYFHALVNSLKLSTGVACWVTLMCIPMAYAFARTDMPGKKWFAALSTVPLVMPTFIAAYAFTLMFGQTGWVNHIWRALGGDGVLFEIKSMLGIILVQVFFFFPYALWPMVAAFKAADGALEEASRNLGAKSGLTFVMVTLSLAVPGILSAMLLVFTISFSDFGTPIIMAPKELNLIVVEAYREIAGFFNWSGSAILTVVMVAVAALFFWLQRWVIKGREYGTISGKPVVTRPVRHKGALAGLMIYTSVVLAVPLLAVGSIFLSSVATTWGHHALPNGYTLRHYATIFHSSTSNIVNSLVLASGALVLSVIIATFISYFVIRRGSAKLDFLSSMPLVVPGIALGIALIQTFNTAPLHLTGTALLLIIAYTIRRMPYMIRSTMGTMMAIRKEMEEASVNLGASPLLAVVTVVGPLLLPGISAGAILVFVTVIKETSITILMAPTSWAPMSLAVFQNLLRGEFYTASAMSILIIAIVVVLQLVARRLTKEQLY